jgi:NhaP-type Na+/H+ and K+/H+ antiporter
VLFPFCTWPSFALHPLSSCMHTLGFLLLSILIRCPNRLSSLPSAILGTGSWFSITLIWLFLILSLLVFPPHFHKYLISPPVILLSCFGNVTQPSEP